MSSVTAFFVCGEKANYFSHKEVFRRICSIRHFGKMWHKQKLLEEMSKPLLVSQCFQLFSIISINKPSLLKLYHNLTICFKVVCC